METPNLKYIEQLSDGDTAFQQKLIDILKKELPEEYAEFQKNFEDKNFIKSAENVHKLKHKISILGLDKGYEQASLFENELRKRKDLKHYESFVKTIGNIDNFLSSL